MRKAIFIFLLLLLTSTAFAADRITATVTITNAPTVNGNTFVITTTSASTRTWTNSVFTPSVQILTNLTKSGSATNLQDHLAANPPAGVVSIQSETNIVTLYGSAGIPLTVSGSGNYFSVSYATQAVSAALTVRVPLTVESAGTQTNVASYLSAWIESSRNTNSLDQNSFALSELVGLTNSQTISGVKQLTSAANYFKGTHDEAVLTNGINYGNAFSSPPTNGSNGEQFGANARADGGGVALGNTASAFGLSAVAIGYLSGASGDTTIAIGNQAQAIGEQSSAIGKAADAEKYGGTAIGSAAFSGETNCTAIGSSTYASEPNATAIGANARSQFANSTAVGTSSETTAANQVMLGSVGVSTAVNNNLTVQSNLTVGLVAQMTTINGGGGSITNGTFYNPTLNGSTLSSFTASKTNLFPANSDISFARLANSGLANGNNAGVIVGTNVFMEVSGPSSAFAINGITASPNRDGKIIIIVNQTGQDMTIAHQSGVDATAGNRIITMTGADRATTGNGAAMLIYSGAASRWILISLDP